MRSEAEQREEKESPGGHARILPQQEQTGKQEASRTLDSRRQQKAGTTGGERTDRITGERVWRASVLECVCLSTALVAIGPFLTRVIKKAAMNRTHSKRWYDVRTAESDLKRLRLPRFCHEHC